MASKRNFDEVKKTLKDRFTQLDSKVIEYSMKKENRDNLLKLKKDPPKLKAKIEEIIGQPLPSDMDIDLSEEKANKLTINLPPIIGDKDVGTGGW